MLMPKLNPEWELHFFLTSSFPLSQVHIQSGRLPAWNAGNTSRGDRTSGIGFWNRAISHVAEAARPPPPGGLGGSSPAVDTTGQILQTHGKGRRVPYIREDL